MHAADCKYLSEPPKRFFRQFEIPRQNFCRGIRQFMRDDARRVPYLAAMASAASLPEVMAQALLAPEGESSPMT